ncbi:MAG: excinuclease ABC subunit UvrA [Acidobacteriota bacterium]|jgi:excinuclease ABC subunit A|nr:excinuclease ABC subunit UvrA [Acidobacteriota bacterium]
MLENIVVRGARQHNLRNISLEIPRNRLTVVTGLSGSGKSSLAFDTIYAEGQRRYIESLSSYARQFLERMEKPDLDSAEGLSPAISIEQKTTSRSPRSTVGTVTEIYDYMRLLFASVGHPHCPNCGKPIAAQSPEQIVGQILQHPPGTRLMILAPVVRDRKGEFKKDFEKYLKKGYLRARIDGKLVGLEDDIRLSKTKNHTVEVVVDRIVVKDGVRRRLEASVKAALELADGLVGVSALDAAAGAADAERLFSERQACVDCGVSMPKLEPRSFSFNSSHGACPACDGLGTKRVINPENLVPDPSQPVSALEFAVDEHSKLASRLRESLARQLRQAKIDPKTPFRKLPAAVRKAWLYGDDETAGVGPWLDSMLSESGEMMFPAVREELEKLFTLADCDECHGSRLRAESRSVKVNGLGISDYARMPLDVARRAFEDIRLTPREAQVAEQVLREIRDRMEFLLDVGVGYLSLDRPSASLSGGEGQRIRLATQIGSKLRGVLYVLDEPSIGLHPRDNRRLLGTLAALRDMGNTILVVEHDEETMRFADHVVDLGPGGGRLGGEVVAQGTPEEVAGSPASVTGKYLSGELSIACPASRRKGNGKRLVVKGARHNNLRDLTVAFPLGTLICVTGVSGSGKSSLVEDILYNALARKLHRALTNAGAHDAILGVEHLDKVIEIDQSPIGRTPRSNPATYTGLFTPLRDLFAMLPESRMRGYKPGRFSFNVKGGRCEECEGDGLRRIEMSFLPDVHVLCETCGGKRYNRETLEVKYKGHSIADILQLDIGDALPLLETIPAIAPKLRVLNEVGLGYVQLGQSSTTLSGGEAQRVKLAKELSRRATGRTLYILDEPTTGLHFDDVRKLLEILGSLVDMGNTVVVIEHNLDVIKTADNIIDMGPEGGGGGGRVVAQGTPEEVAAVQESATGQALSRIL